MKMLFPYTVLMGLVATTAMLDIWVAVRPELPVVGSEAIEQALSELETHHESGTWVVYSPLLGLERSLLTASLEGVDQHSRSELLRRRVL